MNDQEFLAEMREVSDKIWREAYEERATAPAQARKPYFPESFPAVDSVLDQPDRDLMLHMGVPRRFALPRRYRMADEIRTWVSNLPWIYRPTVERQAARPDLFGNGLVLHGPPGNGKTTEAAAMLLDLVRLEIRSTDPDLINRNWHGRSLGMFVDWQEASSLFRSASSINGDSLAAENYRERMMGESAPSTRADFLVIDDVTRERVTVFNLNELHRILRHRANRGLPTILTTNHSPADWEDRFGDVFANFLSRSFVPVQYEGDDS